jgi:hypothetical protein
LADRIEGWVVQQWLVACWRVREPSNSSVQEVGSLRKRGMMMSPILRLKGWKIPGELLV